MSGLRVRDAMVADPVTVDADLELGRFMEEVFLRHRFAAYPVLEEGRPVGMIGYGAVLEIPSTEWPTRLTAEVMTPGDRLARIDPEMPLESALERLAKSGLSRSLVLADGALAGLLSITDTTRIIEGRRVIVDAPEPGRQGPARTRSERPAPPTASPPNVATPSSSVENSRPATIRSPRATQAR